MTTRNAAPMTARLLTGSIAPECDNVVRYDWTEFALVIDWAPGHEQYGKAQTRSVCDGLTLAEAQAEAKRGHEMLVVKMGMATKVKLTLQNRTCTVETTYTPDTHEDGDGTPHRHERVVAGSRWAGPRETERNFAMEAHNAEQALARAAA